MQQGFRAVAESNDLVFGYLQSWWLRMMPVGIQTVSYFSVPQVF